MRFRVELRTAEPACDTLRPEGPWKRQLAAPDGVLVDLSGGEYELLLAYLRSPQIVLGRDQLLDATRSRLEARERQFVCAALRLVSDK